MTTHSSRSLHICRQVTLYTLASILILGTASCSRVPRTHWWQFWRPKATQTSTVYNPNNILPPPPESLGQGEGGTPVPPEGELPPPPVTGEMAEPNPLRQPAQATSELKTVYFDFDSAELTGQAQATLEGNAAWLKANAGSQIQIEGHTDERGTTEYNMNLGNRRALAVKEFLASRGVAADRLHTISYGEERPVDPNHGEAAWAKNRRAQFLVY